jgi:hypothetical protein
MERQQVDDVVERPAGLREELADGFEDLVGLLADTAPLGGHLAADEQQVPDPHRRGPSGAGARPVALALGAHAAVIPPSTTRVAPLT